MIFLDQYIHGREISKAEVYARMQLVVSQFCTKPPPINLMKHDVLDNYDEFMEWLHRHLKPEFRYVTALSIFDASEDIATSQIKNGGEKLINE